MPRISERDQKIYENIHREIRASRIFGLGGNRDAEYTVITNRLMKIVWSNTYYRLSSDNSPDRVSYILITIKDEPDSLVTLPQYLTEEFFKQAARYRRDSISSAGPCEKPDLLRLDLFPAPDLSCSSYRAFPLVLSIETYMSGSFAPEETHIPIIIANLGVPHPHTDMNLAPYQRLRTYQDDCEVAFCTDEADLRHFMHRIQARAEQENFDRMNSHIISSWSRICA